MYSKEFIREEIERVLEMVPLSCYVEGEKWYSEAHAFCDEKANMYGIRRDSAYGICSALSPQKSWDTNKEIMICYLNGVHKHTKVQIAKCDRIMGARSDEIPVILAGSKTVCFYHSIREPLRNNRIVIDRHMLNLAGVTKPPSVNQYRLIETVYKEVADSYNIKYNTLQASLWVYWRRAKHE